VLLELQERLADDDHVQAVEQFISQADHQSLYDAYVGSGSKPYRPERLLAMVVLLILQGIRSPAKWAVQIKNDDRCRLVGRGNQPSRTTLYRFRDRASKFIHEFHTQMTRGAIEQKLINPTTGCLDGTFVAASASRHKMFTLKQISRRRSLIKRCIVMLDDANQTAAAKPLKTIPGWVAKTPAGRQRQRDQFHQAKKEILDKIRLNRSLPRSLGCKEEAIKISPADADAVIGKDKLKTTRPLYNVQNMCDSGSDVILSWGVFRKKNDSGTLIPMIHETRSVTGIHLKKVHSDSGYCSLLEVKDCADLEVELFAPVPQPKGKKSSRKTDSGKAQISADEFTWKASTGSLSCPAGHPMRQVSRSKDPRDGGRHVIELRFEQNPERCCGCELATRCLASGSKRRTVRRLEDQAIMDAQNRKMQTQEGITSKRIRKMRVERRYGDSKKHRGGTQLHGRGLSRADAETGLMVVAQNCLSLFLIEKRRKQYNP
jgi:transposase